MKTNQKQALGKWKKLTCYAIVCAILAITPADTRAEDHVWSSLSGGSFNYWLNWVPNYVPGEDDNAIFELGLDPAYDVTFYEGVTNLRCIFRTDKVNMDLGGFTYTLSNPGLGLVVAENAGHIAEVLLDHGTLAADSVHVGLWEDSDGTLDLVSGLTMDVSGTLTVANDGDGLLNVNNGAVVNAEYAIIGGHDFGNTGVMNVDGSNAEFTVNEILTVGQDGDGTLNIKNGAYLDPMHANVGASATGIGEIYVTEDSEFAVGSSLSLGLNGAGALVVQDAAQASAPGIIRVGWFENSIGDLAVTGEYAGVSTAGYLAVGDGGLGTMTADAGATVEAHTLIMGWTATGDGTLTVSDTDTTLTVEDAIWVGSGNRGICTIESGAEASAWYVCVGATDAADGDLTVSGENTTLTVNYDLDVGQAATGDMTVQDQARVDVTGPTRVGRSATGVGHLTISGANSALTTGFCDVGQAGDGTLTVELGADVDASHLVVASIAGSVGRVDLTDAESSLDVGAYVTVGNDGEGTMDISQQAALTAETLIVGGGSGNGELNITDAGTTVSVINNIQAGQWGTGEINITNGAEVKTTEPGGWIIAGDQAGGEGAIVLDGGGILTAEQAPIVIAGGGQGTMTISGASHVHSSGELFMGGGADSVGQLTISGVGSQYTSASGYPARIGGRGQGTLIIENGGTFEKPGGFILGDESTGVGTVTLNGSNSILKTERLTVGEYGTAAFNINDGRVSLGVEDPSTIPAGEMQIAGWGHLAGTGTITGDVVNINSEVKPGGDEESSLTGILTIDGDYTQQYATMRIKVKGTTLGDEYSSLNVTGTAALDHDLAIEPISGYFPLPGEQYIVLTAGSIGGTFGRITGPGLYDVTYNTNNVTITVQKSPGDLDGDNDVDLSDLAQLLGFYGTPSGATYEQGDIDGDGDVDLSDLAALLSYYGM